MQAQSEWPAAHLQDTELQPVRRHGTGAQPTGHAKQYRRVPDRFAIARQNVRALLSWRRAQALSPLLLACPLNRSGNLVGRMLAALVSFYNPSLVIIGGGVAAAGDMFLATIQQSVYRRSPPLATRDLRVVRSSNIETIGLRGAAFVVLDELFSRARLGQWINEGSPAGQRELGEGTTGDPRP